MAEPNDKELRGPTNLRIKFRSANLDEFIERYAVDVSRGGIFIRTREPLTVGTRLKLDLQLQDAAPLLAGDGTVVWIRAYDPGREGVTPGMGVRFDKLTPESQPTLERILSEKARLQQSGAAPGSFTNSGAGMAVRRPSNVFSALEPPGAAPPQTAEPVPEPPLRGFAARARSGPISATSGSILRPRTTTGMSAAKSAPVPSSLFEPPTADDIDRALSMLEDKSGPAPSLTPPPVIPPPRPHAEDPSLAPTRVMDLSHEAAQDVSSEISSGATVIAGDASDVVDVDDQATLVASAGLPTAASLDAPLADQLGAVAGAAATARKAVVPAPANPGESMRFRADGPVYRPKRHAGVTAAISIAFLAVVAGAAFKLRARLPFMRPPTAAAAPETAATVAATAPAAATPSVAAPVPAPTANAAAPNAPDDKPSPPAEDKPAAPAPAAAAASAPPARTAAASPASKEDRPAKRGPRRLSPKAAATIAAAAGTAADSAAAAPAAAVPTAATPATGAAASAAPAAVAEEAPKPSLKITSTPPGADVSIDGAPVGTTPLASKDVDPATPHAITVKKDGYEPSERMISKSDWSPSHGALSLKVAIKLRKTAAAPPADEAPKETPAPADDPGAPMIKEIKPDSPTAQ